MATVPLLDVIDDELAVSETLRDAISHGEVFTRRWVVDLILDLVGYSADLDLAALRVAEPACGEGAFLTAIVDRLSASCKARGRSLLEAVDAIEAFDLLEKNVELTRRVVAEQLMADGWDGDEIDRVVTSWIRQGDYLLRIPSELKVDFVVGNPPYIRLEDVPDERMDRYRSACSTMGGRADVYVGFYEVGLRSLKAGGVLGFICADRWMRNQYGRNLRSYVEQRFSVELVLTMHDVDAFHEQVSAYPAITVIANRPQGPSVNADTTQQFGELQARELLAWITDKCESTTYASSAAQAARLPHLFTDGGFWPTGSPARLAMLEDLSDRFPLLEDKSTGTRVGIGIATGADAVFITQDANAVEPDRLLPMAMVRDTVDGALHWSGTYLVNPWTPDGGLVDLRGYPRLQSHFARHAEILRRRYVAVKQPERWYKTIDKVDHNLTARQKLLFPDMKLTIHPVLDQGGLYPHHNLYYIISDTWDLRVLGGLLLSKVAEAFVEAYAVKMRGGTLRFQAQYLRKIRVPDPSQISETDRAALVDAFERRDTAAATEAALRVYGLDHLPA